MSDIKNQQVNIMIIGVGNHARRIYIPILKKFEEKYQIKLVCGIEVVGCESMVHEYLMDRNYEMEVTYVPKFDVSIKALPEEIKKTLNQVVRDKNISAVVISTEPLVHKVYAMWAIENGLNILMDKPICLRKDVVSNMSAASGLVEDYNELLNSYNLLQKKKETIFSINVQRRYEPGFQKVFDLIRETRDRFNIPVTSIQAQHADGVWIFPQEILEQQCHPYNQGYGKASHSGYHIFDIVWQIYKNGLIENKSPEAAEVLSSMVQPAGLSFQFGHADYLKVFGSEYDPRVLGPEIKDKDVFSGYGENDVFSLLKLLKAGENICNISINLLHNSFSRRSTVMPGKDLYKGNGRAKAQSYYIQQGPFQCIQIHNYQANDKHDSNNESDYLVGGNNHFDIYVFRNSKLYGPEEKPLKIYSICDLIPRDLVDDSKLFYEVIKEQVILEFVNFILGKIGKKELRSNINTHETPVKIMSAVYRSHILQTQGKGAGASFKIGYEK